MGRYKMRSPWDVGYTGPDELGRLYALAQPETELIAEGVTVTRVYCHSSMADFEGERCPRCGINVYDWILYSWDE